MCPWRAVHVYTAPNTTAPNTSRQHTEDRSPFNAQPNGHSRPCFHSEGFPVLDRTTDCDRTTDFDRFCWARETDLKGYRFPRGRAQEHDSRVLDVILHTTKSGTSTRLASREKFETQYIQAQHSRRLRSHEIGHKHKSDKTHVEEGDRNRVYTSIRLASRELHVYT
jgi:hypothetical protein